LRACGKRPIVAACAAALALIGAGCAGRQTSQKPPIYARIAVSEKSAVYIMIQESDKVDVGPGSSRPAPRMAILLTATSVEGLGSPQAIKRMAVLTAAPGSDNWSASEFTLPVPADQLPAGVTAIKAVLLPASSRAAMAHDFSGWLKVCRTDDRKSEWEYALQIGDFTGGTCAGKAPLITLPDLNKVKARLETTSANGKLEIGLRLIAGSATLTEVNKDGKPVQAQMIVADASGAEVASKLGTLADFGFS